MDSVVDTPGKTVEQLLNIQFGSAASKPGENDFTHIGGSVAVRVLQIKNVRRRPDENTTVVTNHGGGPRQVGGESGRLFESAIPVGILEQFDAAQPFVTPFRIVAHLDDVEPPILIEGHRDRTGNEWFTGGEFRLKAVT